MEQCMASRIWVPSLVVLTFLLGTAGVRAQSVGPDEAVKPDGAVSQPLALTAARRSAIYNAVVRERVAPLRQRYPGNGWRAVALGPALRTARPDGGPQCLGDVPQIRLSGRRCRGRRPDQNARRRCHPRRRKTKSRPQAATP